ncbi:hypothetical protein FBR04_20880 [Betaproteobacteria bacterium PRO7]|jgi:anti-sigma-K factor RskA|nr:hypothetical protein [Betaproteobacteria bacterium PRO7]
MRYDREDLQELLAAEFALGHLRGAARRRMITLMRRHDGLRGKVAQWDERLFPLIVRAPKVRAPRRVWRKIHARIAPRREERSFGGWPWQRIALAGLAVAFSAWVYIAFVPPSQPAFTAVAVLNNAKGEPGILVAWTARQAVERRIRVKIVAHPEMPDGTSWEAWLVRGQDEPPLSLGLVTTEEHQVLEVPALAARALQSALAIGVTVEPKGGSTTGRPSGPFQFQGLVLKVDG